MTKIKRWQLKISSLRELETLTKMQSNTYGSKNMQQSQIIT